MTSDRLDEIIKATAYPESMSVYQAIYQVENEMQQEFNSRTCENCKWLDRKPPQHEHDSWKNTCLNEDSAMWLESPSFTFGCNEFKRKDK